MSRVETWDEKKGLKFFLEQSRKNRGNSGLGKEITHQSLLELDIIVKI